MDEKDSNVGIVDDKSHLEEGVTNAISDLHRTTFYVNNLGRDHDITNDENYKKALDTITDAIEALKPYIKEKSDQFEI